MKIQYLFKKKLGFTLIEILFVILILSLIVVHITQTQQEKRQGILIEKAATDLTSLVPAIINYYVAYNEWPASLSTLADGAQGRGTDFIPLSFICSPFLSTTNTQACNTNAPYTITPSPSGGTLAQGSYLTLSVDTGSATYAQLLSQKLQNAWITGNPGTIVNTAIPAPIFSNISSNTGYLVSGGLVSTVGYLGSQGFANMYYPSDIANSSQIGTSIKLPNCPQGYEGHIILSPINYQTVSVALVSPPGPPGAVYSGFHLTMTTTGTSSVAPSWYDGATNDTDSIVYASGVDKHNNPAYAVTLTDMPINTTNPTNLPFSGLPQFDLLRHEVSFLTICLPSGHWNTNYIPDDNWADGQCSQSWALYEQLLGNKNYFGPSNSSNPYPCALRDNQAFQQQAVGVADAS